MGTQLPYVRVTLWPRGNQIIPNSLIKDELRLKRSDPKKRKKANYNLKPHYENLYPESHQTAPVTLQEQDVTAAECYNLLLTVVGRMHDNDYDPCFFEDGSMDQATLYLFW